MISQLRELVQETYKFPVLFLGGLTLPFIEVYWNCSHKQVSKGEQLQISVKDGTVKARVEEIICQEEIGR